jgi:hypothetical protein
MDGQKDLSEEPKNPNQPTDGLGNGLEQPTEDSIETELTLKQKRFCELYVSEDFFANGTQSYIKAYGIDISKKGATKTAQVSASRLLSNVIVCQYIASLLDASGLNDAFVDKQRLFLITQNTDLAVKRQALVDYDKVQGRILDRVKHEGIPPVSIVVGGGSDPSYIKRKEQEAKQIKP